MLRAYLPRYLCMYGVLRTLYSGNKVRAKRWIWGTSVGRVTNGKVGSSFPYRKRQPQGAYLRYLGT